MSIALVDCDSFYASCERVFRPDLKNRPIVVLSNNDGCVIARSSEAKAMGVKMGFPGLRSKIGISGKAELFFRLILPSMVICPEEL